nr:MAG TPA: hypothetical protein [Caudoviricetes sp.]
MLISHHRVGTLDVPPLCLQSRPLYGIIDSTKRKGGT